jgi:rod shape-determining protein MreD
MRNTAFVAVGVLFLIVQSNMFRLLGVFQDLIDWVCRGFGSAGFDGALRATRFIGSLAATPNLILPLIVFTGVHEYSLARGALLAFVLGYALDLFAAAPVGLFTVVCVTTFVLARVAGLRLAAQTTLPQLALAFVFAAAQGVLVFVLLAIFGRNPYGAKALAEILLPHAVSTALAAPLVFRVAERVHRMTITVPGPAGDGAPR